MHIKSLIEFGLSEKEAKAYIALLELEIAGVQEIAKASGINRSSAYVTLESLKKQGLVSISDDKNVRRYIATPPEAILRSAEDKAHKQEQILKKIEKVVPEMKALFKGTKRKPAVKVFEGKAGLISAFEDVLKSREKLMRVYSAPGNLIHIIGNYLPEFVGKRFKLGIKMRGIHPADDIYSRAAQKPNKYDTYAIVPHSNDKFPADMAIYDDKIGYMSADNGGMAIIIESKEMSSVMKNIFDLAFVEATRIKKNKM